jgi:hypothetical protein
MPTARWGAPDGRAFVGTEPSALSTIEVYNPASNSWPGRTTRRKGNGVEAFR